MRKIALFFDFDNTLTTGDVLDGIIETFSPNEAWRAWEDAWAAGRLSARDCLRLQVENLRVTRTVLFEYLLQVQIDPVFPEIVRCARRRGLDVTIVSDSFLPLIQFMLHNNRIDGVPIRANHLEFAADRLLPSFPYYEPAFPRSANAKARHLAPYRDCTVIYTGDGRSDLDAALVADVVFAKSALARELGARAIPYLPFETLEPVLVHLETVAATRGA